MDVARMIPHRVRSERLMTSADPIGTAIAYGGDPSMQLLFAIWIEFIEPHKKDEADLQCPYCLQNILENFRQMKEELIKLEKEYQLLQSIKP